MSERVPRIRLLFGVDAAASSAAERATDSLGEAVIRLAQIRGTEDEDDDLADPEGAERAHDEIDAHTKAALQALNEFSRAARSAIVGDQHLPFG